VAVDAVAFTVRGGLQRDRAFALVDPHGRYVNAKVEPRLHALRVRYDDALRAATITDDVSGERRAFDLDADPADLAAWLSRVLARPVSVRRDDNGGFPDDERAPGPTVVSTATLEAVAGWFPDWDASSVRRRLRANIEIDGVPAFWEDRLYAAAGEVVPFRVGEVLLEGTNPCQRCVVPSRDPVSGEVTPAFSKRIAERRAATLPPWAEGSRFDHFYRLAVNTRAPRAAGRTIRTGDAVLLEGS
jgi:uncharacterized protein YcbX